MQILPSADTVKQYIPGTPEYDALLASSRKAKSVMDMWSLGSQVYYQLRNRILDNKDFYEGLISRQFNSATTEGELRIVANVGATVLDLIVFLLTNNQPYLQARPRGTSRTDQIEASIAEDLVQQAFRDSGFALTYRDSVKMLVSFAGFIWWFPFWNKEKQFGRSKNHFDFTLLPPLTTRVYYESTDYKKVAHFITTKRMTPESIYKLYDGFMASPDTNNPVLPQDVMGYGIDDGKVTVFKDYDEENVTTIIDGRIAEEPTKHGFDFAPLIQANNVWLLNEAQGETDLFRFLPIAQELNMLISAASEIARDKGWPSILEYNNALANQKVNKWRNQKIPVRRTDKGEALEYLVNPADISAMLKQVQLLLDLFHFVSLMPKAAAGIFDSTVTSGYQAKIAMQPATLSTENKRVALDAAIKQLAKMALYLIEKNDPKALQISDTVKLKDIYEIDFDVVWPENLPIDISREIQNLVLGINSNLTSVTQAIDKYNVLQGMGSSEDTLNYLKEESQDPEINPDRAVKLAQVKSTLAQIGQAMAGIQEKLGGGVMPPQASEGGTPENATPDQQNPTNLARGAASPEQQRPVPQTAREAVTPESTGGTVLPPGGAQ